MSSREWIEYAILNFSAASAIALDACILVISKFRSFERGIDALKWAVAIGITHVLFPMFGFVGGWLFIEKYPYLAACIYALGAILLALLISIVIRNAIEDSEPEAQAVDTNELYSLAKNKEGAYGLLSFWVPVMYVSLDALMSGPGKTVLIDRYPKNLALFSFVLVGGLVGVFVMLAGILSRHLHKRWLDNRLMSTVKFAQVITFGILGELLLFSFFFFWCIADIFSNLPTQYRIEINFALILLGGGVIGVALSIFFFRRIFEKQMIEVSKIAGSI